MALFEREKDLTKILLRGGRERLNKGTGGRARAGIGGHLRSIAHLSSCLQSAAKDKTYEGSSDSTALRRRGYPGNCSDTLRSHHSSPKEVNKNVANRSL
jgi:hypothetical protein